MQKPWLVKPWLVLLHSQSHDRIDPRRATRGDVAGHQRNPGEKRADGDHGERIDCAHLEQQRLEVPCRASGRDKATPIPIATTTPPSRSTMPRIDERSAPSAILTPISLVRCAVAKLITP